MYLLPSFVGTDSSWVYGTEVDRARKRIKKQQRERKSSKLDGKAEWFNFNEHFFYTLIETIN